MKYHMLFFNKYLSKTASAVPVLDKACQVLNTDLNIAQDFEFKYRFSFRLLMQNSTGL